MLIGKGLGFNAQHRRLVKIFGKDFSVYGGGGDNDLEIGAILEAALQESQNKIDVQTPFVGLVYHEHRVAAEEGIGLELLQEDSVGHHLNAGLRGGVVDEAHLVGTVLLRHLAKFGEELFLNVGRNAYSGNSAGLGNADESALIIACLVEDDWQLGGLAAAGRAFDHNDLVLPENAENSFPLLIYRKLPGFHGLVLRGGCDGALRGTGFCQG